MIKELGAAKIIAVIVAILVIGGASAFILTSDSNDNKDNESGTETVYYTIEASSGTGGKISPSGEVEVAEGESKTFTFTADTDYELSHIMVDGKRNEVSGSSYTFSNVSKNHTISAVFEKVYKPVTPSQPSYKPTKWVVWMEVEGFPTAPQYLFTPFNGEGITVTLTYSDGTKSVTDDYNVSPSKFTDIGSQTVTISYLNFSKELDVTVEIDTDTYISNLSELTKFAELVNNGNSFSGKRVYLENNIDMEGVNWEPIGESKDVCFKGEFDGCGWTISNLKVNNPDAPAGLFGWLNGTVKNLTVDGAEITGVSCVGTIAGKIHNTGLIDSVTVLKAKVTGNHYVGGIAGYAYGEFVGCAISDSEIKAEPKDTGNGKYDDGDKVGGIVGWQSNGDITGNTVTDVKLTAYRDVGGIVGYSNAENSTPSIDNNSVFSVTIMIDRSVDAGDDAVNANPIIGRMGEKKPAVGNNVSDVSFVANESNALKALVTGSKTITVNLLNNKTYTTNFNIGEGKNITLVGRDKTVLDGQIATTSSTEGTLIIQNLIYEVKNLDPAKIYDKEISQIWKSGIAIWGNQTVICNEVKFVMSVTDSTAITGWWDTGIGTTIECYDCIFDCNGQRPIRSCGNVTVEDCTFNDPYRYAIQLTAKASTATLLTNAVVNFYDNTIVNGPNGNAFVYGIQLEGKTYGCNDLIINGAGNKIDNGGENSTMYYCDCGKVNHSTIVWNTEVAPVHENSQKVDSPETLKSVLTGAGAAGSGDSFIEITTDLDMTNVQWTPITVDGYHGADVVTINGNGKMIKGISAPLFAGGFAGGSGIVIRDLTIADSNIVSSNVTGSGAFIESIDSMDTITLINCHLKDSSVTGSRTGGLIGWTSGYNNPNDGPVKTYVTIRDCSVTGCTINGSGSVGGINGHAGANAWTYTTIENCIVENNELTSTKNDVWQVGVVVGTANVGEVIISGITESGNTLTQTGKTVPTDQSNLYGRFVPGATGILVIDGEPIIVSGSKVATDTTGVTGAINDGVSTVIIGDTGTGVKLPSTVNGKDLTFRGISTEESVITVDIGQGVGNANLTFVNVTIKTNNTDYTGIQHSGDVIYTDCVFDGSTNLYGKSVTFNNCTFNLTSRYIWTYGAGEVTFNNCTFNTNGKALLIYAEGGVDSQIVNINNCTFNATKTAYTGQGDACAAVEIDSSLIKGKYVLNFSGDNVVDEDFNGLYRIKKDKTPSNVIVIEH